jgi:hypothetical protein
MAIQSKVMIGGCDKASPELLRRNDALLSARGEVLVFARHRIDAVAPIDALWFVDITSSRGIDFQYLASHTSRKYLPETMAAGVALFDLRQRWEARHFPGYGAPLADGKGYCPGEIRAEILESPFSPESGWRF